jgi:hypothetical protein
MSVRASRSRLAPSAWRTASSGRRSIVCTIISPATFAQAISSTSPTPASSASSAGRVVPKIDSAIGRERTA